MVQRYVSSVVLVGLLVFGLVAPVTTVVLAQITQVGKILDVKPALIYPGEPVTVTVEVFMATTYTVKLCNSLACGKVWASVTRYASVPGIYDVIATLPERLEEAVDDDRNGLIDLWVVLEVWGNPSDYLSRDVNPKTVVTPSSATIVTALGADVTATVRFLGYVPGDSIGSIRFEGPLTVTPSITPVTIDSYGTGSATVNLRMLTGGRGLPRGTYRVTGIPATTPPATNIANAKPGSLEIRPQVLISPTEGSGRCEVPATGVCELTGITLTGYGFSRSVRILRVDLFNINFTNVRYTFSFPPAITTDTHGYFTVTNLKQYIAGGRGTNMTAGLYIPIVYEAPVPTTITNTTTIPLATVGRVVISESAVFGAIGTRASVTATSFVDARLEYVPTQSRMSYVLAEVLRINISYGGRLYQLAANLEGTVVRFALYNITRIPFELMFTGTATPTPDPTTGANVAHVSFNIKVPPYTPGTDYVLTPPPTPGAFRYWATFYSYPNQILLRLQEYSLVVTRANLTVTYANRDTGTTVSRYYVHPTNMTVADYTVRIPTLRFTDGGVEWTVEWSYTVTTREASIRVTAAPVTGPSFEFRNVYYLVRPLLVILTSGVIEPGATVTLAAYGYGPGAAWGYPGFNTLTVYWEKIAPLGTFTPGKDGNLTFRVKIPDDATFGVHYIWGVDKWGYEYTLAVIVGAKAYWYTGKVRPEVWAGYNDKRFSVCPCPESAGVKGLKYCAQCAVYTGACDYLGDVIKVVIAGLSPGETIRVYFGTRLMLTARANKSTEEVSFVVPSVPEGTYTITVVGTASGTIEVRDFFNTTRLITASPRVVPKVLILDLNKNVIPVLVGSGFVRVIGSGFSPGISIYAVLFNGTDAAYTLNAHVTRWISDAKGMLTSPFTDVLGVYVPVVEPGAYAISLAYALPNGTIRVASAGYVFVVNNISILLTKAELDRATATLSSKLDALSASLSGAVTTLTTKIDAAVTELRSRIDAATGTITSRIDSSSAALSSKIDSAVADIKGKIDASTADVKAAVDAVSRTLSTAVATVSSKVDAVGGKVDTVSTAVATVSSKVDAVAGTLKTVSDSLSAVAKDVDSIKAEVGAVKTDVGAIKTDVADIKVVKTDVAALKSEVAGLKTDVTSVKTDAAALKTDVAGLRTDVSAVPGRVDAVTTYSLATMVLALLAAIMSTISFIILWRHSPRS